MRTTRSVRLGFAAVAIALLVAAGCGSDDKDSSSTTTTAASPGTTAVSNAEVVKFDKTVQQQLADVGCYTGAIDGILGPQTDAAIVAFQTASGLTVDGELGPETETALSEAASKKEKVCTSTGTTTAPSTTTTAPTNAPCTATALAKALPAGSQIQNYACSEGFAGVAFTNGGKAETALMEANGAVWTDKGTSACGGASAGYPPAVLEIACPS